MSGSFCATTGSRTGSSPPMRPSSITVVPPGTSSPTNPGASCPSVSATGPTGSDQRDLVSLGPFKDASAMYLDDLERWRSALERAEPLPPAIESEPTHDTLPQSFEITPEGLFADIPVRKGTQRRRLIPTYGPPLPQEVHFGL